MISKKAAIVIHAFILVFLVLLTPFMALATFLSPLARSYAALIISGSLFIATFTLLIGSCYNMYVLSECGE